MSLATVSIVGNLVKDPEQVSFASGRTKTRIIVAVNPVTRANRENEMADFYKVEAWGKLGELSANYLAKGNQVTVTGRLVFERWTDKEGKERMTPLVEANQIAFPRRLKVVDGSRGDDSAPAHADESQGFAEEDPCDPPIDMEAAASLLQGRTTKAELPAAGRVSESPVPVSSSSSSSSSGRRKAQTA